MTSYKLQAGIYIPEIISKYDGKVEVICSLIYPEM